MSYCGGFWPSWPPLKILNLRVQRQALESFRCIVGSPTAQRVITQRSICTAQRSPISHQRHDCGEIIAIWRFSLQSLGGRAKRFRLASAGPDGVIKAGHCSPI